MLLDYNKKELEELARLYCVKGVSKLKKAELIDALTELIPTNMQNGLVMLDMKDLQLFEGLLAKDKEINYSEEILDYYNLMELGLLNLLEVENGVTLTVDARIKEQYKKLDKTSIKEQVKANSKLRTHILGLLNLYGAAEISWVCELYRRYHNHSLSEKQLIDFIKKDRFVSERSKVKYGYIAEETIYSVDEKNFYDFIELTKNKPYYVPTKEYIEHVSNELYYDNTLQVQKLKSYIKKKFTQDEDVIEEAVLAVIMIARVDCNTSSNTITLMLEEWSGIGIEIKDLAEANETVKHITAVMNTTRKWINKGYTPQELSPSIAPIGSGTKVRKLDVERNALCPCGSGKKYKKCCGKPQ
ncbi:MAG: motif domain protein [Clostridia bacterium]|jgi:hypothetical protein|nr:motif domain protein [Clostridia bacterium]